MDRQQMQAIRLNRYGNHGVALESIPVPVPGPGQVAIQVHAAGLNPVDWKIRDGAGDWLGLTLPVTLGCDVAGTIQFVGQGIKHLRPGDEVYGYLSLKRLGAFAELALAEPGEIAPKPAALSWEEAAALPVAALTAWQALFDHGQLQPGERVLVHAAAGGVGSAAVQLAVWKGAEVLGTASAANLGYLQRLGVHQPVDYTAAPFEEQLEPVDLVLDSVGGEVQARSYSVLRRGGRLVSITSPPDQDLAQRHGAVATRMAVQPNDQQLQQVTRLVEESLLNVTVAQRLPFARFQQAFQLSMAGHVRGKIVLVPDARD